jgi:hypothetical protein
MKTTQTQFNDPKGEAGDKKAPMNPHHPRCEHYTPPPADPRYDRFGEAMWKYITNQGGDFCGEEISEDILPLAQAAGLCCRVEYDPAIHGETIEADPSDEIWWWGDFDWIETSPSGAQKNKPMNTRSCPKCSLLMARCDFKFCPDCGAQLDNSSPS